MSSSPGDEDAQDYPIEFVLDRVNRFVVQTIFTVDPGVVFQKQC